ncbi:MAG: Electron transfer flavoprotein subunit beta [Firmicutes bacterium ADurb.Bin456]|nr:MAG: Electron transfer flavoprotein subunit beta [Firmicutes bacterium ADurb.Bin456]
MEIIVIVRKVPDPASIEVDQRTGLVDFRRIVYITCPPDLCAVEEGLRLREKTGGQVTVLAPGPPDPEDSLRECLALGADRVFRIWGGDWPREIFPPVTGFVLARVIRDCTFDLVLSGENGGPYEADPLPAWLSEYLQVPLVTAVTELKMADGGQGLLLERKLEKGRRQVLECKTPALLTVDPSLNQPRESSLPALLRALEAVIETIEVDPGSALGLLPEGVCTRGGADGLLPFSPPPRPIFTPASTMPARARIEQMLSGGLTEKGGLPVDGLPGAVVERIIAFLQEKGFLGKAGCPEEQAGPG